MGVVTELNSKHQESYPLSEMGNEKVDTTVKIDHPNEGKSNKCFNIILIFIVGISITTLGFGITCLVDHLTRDAHTTNPDVQNHTKDILSNNSSFSIKHSQHETTISNTGGHMEHRCGNVSGRHPKGLGCHVTWKRASVSHFMAGDEYQQMIQTDVLVMGCVSEMSYCTRHDYECLPVVGTERFENVTLVKKDRQGIAGHCQLEIWEPQQCQCQKRDTYQQPAIKRKTCTFVD